MPAIHKNPAGFRADRAWGARDIAEIDGASVRLHWTDEPYVWHVNDGAEVFVVVEGRVRMDYRDGDAERSVELGPGEMFVAEAGDAHCATPLGEARILVVERKGSI